MGLEKGLRRRQIDARGKLWANLRDKRFNEVKFQRQQHLGKYILDFISFGKKLIIEVDSGQPDEAPNIEKEKQRAQYLEGRGYRIIRFSDNDVLKNIEGVMSKINEAFESQDNS